MDTGFITNQGRASLSKVKHINPIQSGCVYDKKVHLRALTIRQNWPTTAASQQLELNGDAKLRAVPRQTDLPWKDDKFGNNSFSLTELIHSIFCTGQPSWPVPTNGKCL